ncbi:MAG: DUF962 domain-containing protein [Bacteroidia bacterium]|nr:DUF962 domain-containing protein [Bacteroidia bacterium]
MRTIDALLEKYGESHQNKVNKLIHWICVPSIFFSIVGLLYAIPLPGDMPKTIWVSWATLIMVVVYIYYLRLSTTMFLAFVGWGFFCLWGNDVIYHLVNESNSSLALINLIIFAVAWVFQFVGHKIEGKKPSFLDDVKFLLIGPAWLLHFIMKRLGVKY